MDKFMTRLKEEEFIGGDVTTENAAAWTKFFGDRIPDPIDAAFDEDTTESWVQAKPNYASHDDGGLASYLCGKLERHYPKNSRQNVLSFWYADSAEKKVTRKPLSKVESSISLKNTVARLGGSVGKVTTSPGIVNVYADKTQAADGKVYVLYPVTEVLNLTVPAARKRARTGGLIDMDTVMPKNTVKASGGYVTIANTLTLSLFVLRFSWRHLS
jgi:hypothetical protein